VRTTGGIGCPTCGAPFRGTVTCGRCGADLAPLTAVILAAREERELARRAILDGDGDAALLHIDRALALHRTEWGLRLKALALIAANRPLEGVRLASTLVK
jgi:hypothetical protein